jgi:hypothetical protein
MCTSTDQDYELHDRSRCPFVILSRHGWNELKVHDVRMRRGVVQLNVHGLVFHS